MTKPVIVTRLGKGSELTFQEGDNNFTNLRDATISVSGDSGTTQNIDLNGTVTVAGGTGLSSAMSSNTVTLNLDNTAVTPGSYTKASVTVDAQGRITAAASGSADFTQSDARNSISVTDAGGEGSLAYENSTGVITYTGPSFTGLEVTSAKNQANGYAGLDSNGKVASAQLPSYVDDVVEAANFASLPAEGETGKIYVALDNGKIYRWSGSAYVEISASPGSTDSVTEGSTNLYFTTQRARDAFSASTGITITNGVIATTITQYADSNARSSISVTDSGGDGSLSYNSSTGVITYTGPSATEVRSHFSAGTGISIADGVITNTVTNTNTTYAVSAETATGGVNLRLTGSDSSTDNVKLAEGSNITITRTDADTITISGSSGGIASVSADTTPQLGGNLNVASNSIVSVSNGNIVIAPDGSGIVRADKSVQLQSQGELRLADSDSSNYVGFKSPATVTTNRVWTLPAADGTDGQVLSTNGSGSLAWATAGGGSSATNIIKIAKPTALTMPGDGLNDAALFNNDAFTLLSSGGVSGVSVSGSTLTLPAGSYFWEFPTLYTFDVTTIGSNGIWQVWNNTTGAVIAQISTTAVITLADSYAGTATKRAYYGTIAFSFTLSNTSNIRFKSSYTATEWYILSFPNVASISQGAQGTMIMTITKTA
jgi:hypothetical protein